MKYEEDFRYKYENTLREIGNLKSEIDTLQINLKEKNMEFQELKVESVNFSEINEQDLFDLNKTLKEIAIIKEEHQIHYEENKKMQRFLESLQEEKKKIVEDIKVLSNEIDNFENTNFQLEKKLTLIEDQNKELDLEQKDAIRKNEAVQYKEMIFFKNFFL